MPALFCPDAVLYLLLLLLCLKRWALWYDNAKLKAATETWADNLKHILGFDSIEEFWGLYNNVLPPSMLSVCMV